MDTIVATDVVVFRGALSATTPTYETMVGTSSIIANSGTLFNISASTYNLWRAGSYTLASERLTFAHVMAGLAKAIVRGLTEDVLVLMSPFSWIDIMDDLSALKQFKEDTKSDMSMGTQGITFYGPMNGKVTLKSHPMMKAGQAQAYPTSVLKRVGSSDATMKIPNATGQNDNMFVELADSAGSQIRIYSDFGIISKKPARMVGFSGIVNNSLAA
jgi:hypothetical protein